ncbi:DUF3037 domain-containing protein [Cochlodiniinecator piscidefendens]|uniref:DUF3037 domain-containing protein n=1 Tax=Cochlodiniinecator piscidefendens TaxID=2715756 RepID=UPI0014097274|nr:DUF3037 domain-containing protein [Cochlodiniinecator piscidefendens]
MTSKKPYSYVVLRYVHDIITGEFVNVGVLLVSPNDRRIFSKTRKTIGRIKKVFPDLDKMSFVTTMKSFDTGVRKVQKLAATEGLFADQKNAGSYASQILPFDDSSLRWTAASGGLTSDIEKTFDRLYERHVGRYDIASPARKSDEDVWRPVRDMLAEREIPLRLESKIVNGDSDSIEFTRAWKNGSWHVYEPLTLDLTDADGIKDKARRWRGHLSAVADGASEQVHLNFLLGKPDSLSLRDAYASAIEILKGSPFKPKIYEESDLIELVNEIEDEFREHQQSLGVDRASTP